jgi:futalosine hydrolase
VGSQRGPLLLLSATEFEVEPLTSGFQPVDTATPPLPHGWRARSGRLADVPTVAVATGVGKVNAAAITALAVNAFGPAAVLLVGIGGAFAAAGLTTGQAALAESDTHLDTGVGHGASWTDMRSIGFALLPANPARGEATYNHIEQAPATRALATELGLPALAFGTSESVTADSVTAQLLSSRHGVAIESMEGAAVAQVAAALGVAAYQVRGVSNAVGDRDKATWRVADAVTASCAAALRLTPLLPEVS